MESSPDCMSPDDWFKYLQGRMQVLAGTVASTCGSGCKYLRLRWAKLAPKSSVLFWTREKGGETRPIWVTVAPPDLSTEPIYRLNLNTDNLVFHVKSNEVSSHDGTSLKLILVSKVKRLFVRITVANYVKIYNVAKYSAMFLNTF